MPCDPGPPPEAHACGLRVGGDLASAPALYGWLHARDGRARGGTMVRYRVFRTKVQ